MSPDTQTGGGSPAGLPAKPEAFYRTVLESLSEAVVLVGADQRIFYANRMATEITGYPPEELLGQSGYELLLPEGRAPQRDCSATHPALGRTECFEVEIKRKDGQLHWVHVKTTQYRNDRGEIDGTILAFSCLKRQKCLEWEKELLQDEVRENFGDIIGGSPAIQKVLAQIATVAPTEANVLVLGESGTGKELVARAIHDLSARKEHPLVRVNCASIPKELFESEFFGHVRGAFTGAVKDRVGRFELADAGTLFLDEVGEIPLELQSKLLRVLQEGQFEGGKTGPFPPRPLLSAQLFSCRGPALARTFGGRGSAGRALHSASLSPSRSLASPCNETSYTRIAGLRLARQCA